MGRILLSSLVIALGFCFSEAFSPSIGGQLITSFASRSIHPYSDASTMRSSPFINPDLATKSNQNNSQQHHHLILSATSKNTQNDDDSIIDNNWTDNINKKSVLATAALIAAVAFANPSSSTAAMSSDIVGAIGGGGTGPLTASASALLERLSETGFYQAFSLVFVSEIGDKTFFIAGLLAMKAGKFVSLVGSIGALAAMTVLSVIIGQLFHAVPSGLTQGLPFDDIAAILAFTFFGLKTLKEASEIQEGEASGIDEEFADAEEAVEGSQTIKEVTAWGKIVSTFGLVFAAEFGDRSFLSTIALSAAQNPFSVGVGAIAAHAIATAIAVAGGSYVAKYISEKAIGYIGGSLFLVFAITTALGLF